MGLKRLKYMQLGEESVKGTEVAATVLWRGKSMISEDQEFVLPEEEIAVIPGADRSYIPKEMGAVLMEETPVTMEQLPYILNAGIDNVAGVQDGAGTDYIYDYILPTTALQDPVSYTLEGGDNTQEEQMLYAMVKNFTLSGKAWEAVMMSAVWFGRAVATGTKTGALAAVAVDELMFGNGKVYIDAGGGTIGASQIVNTVKGFSLSVNTGLVPIATADDRIDYTLDGIEEPIVTLNLTMLNNSVAVAEKAAQKAETTRLIRLTFEAKNNVATPGTTYSKKTLNIDLAGKWKPFPGLTEEDGQNVVTGIFEARYSSADALFAEILCVNELTALA